ncbi:MAG: universal stress protein [Halanaeroarchaeum sp.]
MYDRILLATDGSEAAESAATEAIDIAVATGSTLSVLFVADSSVYSTVTVEGDVADVLEEEGRTVTEAIEARAGERGVAAESTIRQGRPWREIVAFADAIDADLIVMGSAGESGFSRRLLGSTTDRVLRETDVPVHVVPPT